MLGIASTESIALASDIDFQPLELNWHLPKDRLGRGFVLRVKISLAKALLACAPTHKKFRLGSARYACDNALLWCCSKRAPEAIEVLPPHRLLAK